MVLQSQYPNDTRVEREARLLRELGHEVHLLCERREAHELEAETVEGVRVERMVQPSGLAGKAARAVSKLTGLDPAWFLRIRSFVASHRLQVLHVHDQPLVLTACRVARRDGMPVVFDVHDRVPIAMEAWDLAMSWNEKLLMNAARMRRFERQSIRKAAAVICATRPYRNDFLSDGVAPEKLVVLENVVDLEWFRRQPIAASTLARYSGYFVILYVGSFGARRGLDVAVTAMPIILKRVPDARLVLVGPPARVRALEEPTVAFLRSLASRLGVSRDVVFVGPVDRADVRTYVELSNVCIILLDKIDHYDRALANKLFEYMAGSRPVVVTDVRATRTLVEEAGCGVVVPPRDPAALAAAVIRLHDDPALAAAMGRKGCEAVEQKHNVRAASQEFRQMYVMLEQQVLRSERLRAGGGR